MNVRLVRGGRAQLEEAFSFLESQTMGAKEEIVIVWRCVASEDCVTGEQGGYFERLLVPKL